MKILLQGTVGSTAYGLNGPDSDIDTLAMGTYQTQEFFKLAAPKESMVTHSPDMTIHEAGKYCRLALKCNPTVTELMWLDDYDIVTYWGAELIDIRNTFLSEKYVREAYLGYAKSQLTRLQDRDHKRATKHAMHMARLTNQGYELYTTGKVTIKVQDPQWYHNFKLLDRSDWIDWFNKEEAKFRAAKCVLPAEADTDPAEQWLLDLRSEWML